MLCASGSGSPRSACCGRVLVCGCRVRGLPRRGAVGAQHRPPLGSGRADRGSAGHADGVRDARRARRGRAPRPLARCDDRRASERHPRLDRRAHHAPAHRRDGAPCAARTTAARGRRRRARRTHVHGRRRGDGFTHADGPLRRGGEARRDALRPVWGCCVLGLSAHQPHPPSSWSASRDYLVAIHGGAGIGTAVSAGCLHLDDASLRYLMRTVPVGTPVFVKQ